MQARLSRVARGHGTARLAGRAAFVLLVAYAVVLGLVLLSSAPVDMRVQLPVYGGDRIAFGHAGAAVIAAGVLVAALGAWLVSLGLLKNGALSILLGCAAPQLVTSSPVSLVLSVPTLIFAIVAGASMARTRRIMVPPMPPSVRVA